MKYYFIVDTDTYAGNFEREMCAHITGQVGECDVGQDIAKKAKDNIPLDKLDLFEEHIMQEPDEHGCHRPCKIYPTPGYHNHGLGFEFVDGEEDKAIEAYAEHCLEESKINYYKDKSANESHKQEWLDKSNNAANEYGHYPSYQSVAIGFYDELESDIIKLMKLRAQEFAELCRNKQAVKTGCRSEVGGFNIEGFRLVTECTTTKEKSI